MQQIARSLEVLARQVCGEHRTGEEQKVSAHGGVVKRIDFDWFGVGFRLKVRATSGFGFRGLEFQSNRNTDQ